MKTVDAFLMNNTRKTVLAQRGRVLRGLSMGFGAMFRGLPGSFVFVWWRPARIAITNLFVFEDIDILWLDTDWRVVSLHQHFKAWSLRTVNDQPAKYVIELPAGTIAVTRTRIGDRIHCTGYKG